MLSIPDYRSTAINSLKNAVNNFNVTTLII